MKKSLFSYILTPLLAVVFIVSIVLNIAFIVSIKTNDYVAMSKEEFLKVYAEESGGEPLTLPIIEINTEDEKFPQDKETYVNCSFKLSNTGIAEYDFEKPMATSADAEGGVGIRLRGNSTLNQPKKPFRIKFNNKQSLLGLTAAKSWVLLADYLDNSKIRNFSAFHMGASIFDNLPFVPSANHCVVIINNMFQGLYLLTEQVDENKGRTDVEGSIDPAIAIGGTDYNFPFLVEIGSNDFVENINGFYLNDLGGVEIKYPDFTNDNISNMQPVFNYIKSYIEAIYNTFKTGEHVGVPFSKTKVSFKELINEESFIDWNLLNEYMLNRDASYYSIYISKKTDEVATFGPIWDFDCASILGYDYNGAYHANESKLCISHNSMLFNNYLKDERNYAKVQARWREISDKIETFVINDLSQYKKVIYSVAGIDAMCWYGEKNMDSHASFSIFFDAQRAFMLDRLNFLNKTFTLTHQEFFNEVNENYLDY